MPRNPSTTIAGNPADVVHKPKLDPETNGRVIKYGGLYRAETVVEQKMYVYRHQRADLQVSEGHIPIGFLATMWLEEGYPLYIETRAGGWDDDEEKPRGPEYLVSWKSEMQAIPPIAVGGDERWSNNLDDLWVSVLAYFERKNHLSEDSLEMLDADPFVLFCIDSAVTQQAIKKLDTYPALFCESVQPSRQEWADYLRIPPGDKASHWLIEAMMEPELPKPWTCYKGAGSIVCFIRTDTQQVTWKHPSYDYFRQLRDYCRQATIEECLQIRVNRLFWSYEASRIETEHYQEPLISPEYVEKLAKIYGYNIVLEGCIMRNLKAALKLFAITYRASLEIDLKDVINTAKILQKDVDKGAEMKHEWGDGAKENFSLDLKGLSNGEVACVNCDAVALSFCLECRDYLCLDCYDLLHRKGGRREHAPFRLVACSLCVEMPAKLHCTFTDKHLCHECYAMKHIRLLPPDGKENQPRRIEYDKQYVRYATFAKERSDQQRRDLKTTEAEEGPDEFGSILSSDWHPFYDSRGVKFYHNFCTGERMRQSPTSLPNSADPGAPADLDVENLIGTQYGEEPDAKSKLKAEAKHCRPDGKPLTLTGFDSMFTGPRAPAMAAAEPENRNVRAPLRVHMPNEVPQP